MVAKLIFPMIALTAGSLLAGERVTFDFDWQFKYFGPNIPTETNSNATATSTQPGHPASLAIDGKRNTRWCAADMKPGYTLSVINSANDAKVDKIVILWENGKKKSAEVKINARKPRTTGFSSVTKTIDVDSDQSTLNIGGREVRRIDIKVNGTGKGNWASIREVIFLDEAGKPIRIAPPADVANVPAEATADYEAKGFKSVQLPHDWAIESRFLANEPNETGKLPWNGYGWYRKTFDVPATFDKAEDRYYLDFDGVMSCPQVYVNGKKAGEWAYGYNSFRVDITPFLKKGENLVAVMASNKPLSTRWYPGAGIYRHVWLEKTGPIHLAQWGVFVKTAHISKNAAVVDIETTVDNTDGKAGTVTVQHKIGDVVSTPVEVTVKPGKSHKVITSVQLPNPELWSCENPHLYTAETTVSKDGKVIDSKETTFGVRSIEWRKEGFFLNGKKVRLNGVCEHHDLGPLGAAFYTRGYERKIEILKEMGCNSIRMTHNPPAPEVLDLCDKHGILVMDELFDIWKFQKYGKTNGYHVFWPEWWKKDVRNFVLRDRNHPCIIAWSGGNEVPEIHSAQGAQICAELREEFRKYDTTRPYTVGVNDCVDSMKNGFAQAMDVFGFNYRPHFYPEFRKRFPNMPFYGSETNSCVGTRGTYFFPVGWKVGDGARMFQVSAYGLYAPHWGTCPDAEFTAQAKTPDVAGEYVWTGFDYLGEPTPYNQDQSNVLNLSDLPEAEKKQVMAMMKEMGNRAPSRSSYFGIIDLAGLPKDTYYLYQSQWRPELAQAHILPHWNWAGREGQKTPVMVFTSGDEAELFINGKSQGVRRRGDGGSFTHKQVHVGKNDYRFVWEDTVYEPGEVRVVVKKDGKPWAEDVRVTSGSAASVKAVADRTEIAGDGRDLSYITLSVHDAKGNVVPTDCRKVSFSIEGAGELIGFCNGNPVDHRCMQDPDQAFFNGYIVAVVRGKRGASGPATITIKPEGLPATTTTVNVTK